MSQMIGWTVEAESDASGMAAWRIVSMHATREEAQQAVDQMVARGDAAETRILAYCREPQAVPSLTA
jgi:hypothetical protein